MRLIRPLTAMFLLIVVATAGCTTPVDQDEELARHVPEGQGCPGEDPKSPVPPDQQRVQEVAGLQCAGQFVVLDEGTGDRWEAPRWNEGDTWEYQIVRFSPAEQCIQRYSEAVADNGTSWDIDVYSLVIHYSDCAGNLQQHGTTTYHRTQDSLQILRSDGWVSQENLFPLADGKKWAYVDGEGRFVEVEVMHDPEFVFNEPQAQAWRIQLTRPAEIVEHRWWVEDVANMVRQERWVDGELIDGRILESWNRFA